MSVLIKGMELPSCCMFCPVSNSVGCGLANIIMTTKEMLSDRPDWCPLVPVPPHGDLIDRDALIKDGWLCLYKEVVRMGGYAIHELPLKNPSIPVIIEAEGEET